jgi:hypothetical protein
LFHRKLHYIIYRGARQRKEIKKDAKKEGKKRKPKEEGKEESREEDKKFTLAQPSIEIE